MRHPLSRLIAGAVFTVLAGSTFAADESDPIGHFQITRFAVEGNTLLPAVEVDRLLTPFAGSERNFGHVQMALETLEAAYHARGYNVVQVVLPEQELNQGVVRLQVVETRLGKVKVEGNTVFSEDNIRRSLPALTEGQVPNLGDVSSSLRLANENPAKKTTLQLQTGDKDDEINAVLGVTDDKVWKVGATLDNSGNANTGKSQLTMQFQHANMLDRDHVMSVQYTTTLEKPSQVSVYGVGYHIPLYALGDSVDLFASYSDVDSGSVLAGIVNLQVSGRGTVVGGRYNQLLRRAGDYESRITYGLDYKQFQNNVDLSGVQLGNDVTVHPLSVAYTGILGTADGELSFTVTGMRNIPGGDKGKSADFDRVRAGAPAGYSLMRLSAGYSRLLPQDWQLRFSLAGQYSPDSLVPGEQFGAGGASTVRGFDERDISSDKGLLASAEVYTPNFCGSLETVAAQCRALVFYDTATVRRNNALAGEIARASIGSIGVGLRVSVSKYMTMQMDYGHVIDGGTTQLKGDNKLHFRLGLTY
ncbi:ShlB/FhaC/HecB family hemolysin secretion/activation protein [Noviherbaspirillum denitrificans]|uniref:Peptidase S37 n=1 Tax=Noviherbaspirillum denitrificans TaxID=1968433 RepID=A0A254T7Z8_9BURK|nr:ShlB/FhaC/HecB family hemolysin secretion/activation protein [Noviherbaspirillum denitrificans]OWW18776.1 peptidase S37 [Noviherbaspirillum denitrificans]